MNDLDFIVTWLLGVILIAGLVAIVVFAPLIIGAAYQLSTPIVKVME